MTILDDILARKRDEVAQAKARRAPDELFELASTRSEPTRRLREALRSGPPPRIIAEIKRRSPSRGEIRPDFDPVGIAKAYADAGAAAISVLTDETFFGGHLDFLAPVRAAVAIPLLRKDFVIDPYQIDEARLAGADAVLLIASAFPAPSRVGDLAALLQRANRLDLDALVEVHTADEAADALSAGADLIGVNNRDLATFEVDLAVSERLLGDLPSGVVAVSESGIFTPEDVERLQGAGAHAFLVGEALMRQEDIGLALRRLRRIS